MSSIVTAVLKATFGVLVNKARDKVAEKLREGDVMDGNIGNLIVREIDDIKFKLDGLSGKDLRAAIDAFQTGLNFWRQAMDAETGEKTRTSLSEGKERFKMAREKATEACNNEALSTLDRITAIQYRVMATMFESAAKVNMETARNSSSLKDVLERAMPECQECLQKLHCLPDVQSNFKVELNKALWNVRGRFGKDERREIISAVCQVNRAIYDARQAAGVFTPWFDLPVVDTGEDKIDPLHDPRVAKLLQKVGTEHCCITPWSFGQEGEEEHKLKEPSGIATNADGQFIIADNGDMTVKVFDSSGNFILKFSPHNDDDKKTLVSICVICDVATDEDDNIYVLVRMVGTGVKRGEDTMVLVFNSAADQLRKFPVKEESLRLLVSKSKVMVVVECYGRIHVYETDGGYVRSFGSEIVKDAIDITAGPDGRVLVLDWGDGGGDIHVFTEDGQQLTKFSVRTKGAHYDCVACHPGSEHVIVAGVETETHRLRLAIYTKDGECQRKVTLNQTVDCVSSITASMVGNIGVTCKDLERNGKVIMF